MIKPVHPFPARMAPGLAIAGLKEIERPSIVLDPMVGSGTVVRQASELGHHAIGFDMDPLAILMSKVWTTPVNDMAIEQLAFHVLNNARSLSDVNLPWIDDDEETKQFVEYWFADPQRSDLKRLAAELSILDNRRLSAENRAAADVLRLSLSRIIITKNRGASLARDVSHSRPHKVMKFSNYEVFSGFDLSVKQVRRLLASSPPPGNVVVRLGDARCLNPIENGEIDVVLTSPPYLNAIDYMRGHRLSLVWLGYRLSELRNIRSNSIGAERGPNAVQSVHLFKDIQEAMGPIDELPRRYASMIARYSEDVYRFMSEVARVLKKNGKAIFIIGNSCLKDKFIQNSKGLIKAASMVGLKLFQQIERELPAQNRYLPIPSNKYAPLGKRMRTESILTFLNSPA
jgi:hypothetical protein